MIRSGGAWGGGRVLRARVARCVGAIGSCAIACLLIGPGVSAASPSVPVRPSARPPIVLIGLDGADWQIIDPLIDQGRLPHLAALRQRSARGSLRSEHPMLSPLLWTTIATGRTAADHGIIDFLVADPATGQRVPITSAHRRTRAIWNIASEAGLRAHVVAWWATWPAEEIRGTMVSDRLAYSLFGYRARPEDTVGLISPPAAMERAARLRVDESDITLGDLRRFADFTPADLEAARARIEADAKQGYADPLNHLIRILASTRTYHALARDLARRGDFDLLAIYYQGIDEISHRYAHYIPPRLPWVDEAGFRRFRDVVFRYYEHQDALIGEIVEAAGDDALVMVLSDHGFLSRSDRPDHPPDIELKAGAWHRLYGIFMLAGPGVRLGPLETVGLYDIAPTLIWLLGLPVPSDMPGRPVTAAMDDPTRAHLKVTSIETYETAAPAGPGRPALPATSSEEILARLRSLGYIGGTGGEGIDETAIASPTITNLFNLATVQLQQGQAQEAESSIRAVLERLPEHGPSHALLSECLEARGDLEEALREARTALNLMSRPEGRMVTRYAYLARRLGHLEEAKRFFLRYAQQRPGIGEPWMGLGLIQIHEGEYLSAERSFLRALDLSPRSTGAITGLYNVYERGDRGEETRTAIEAAAARNPDSAPHHALLGLVYSKERRVRQAEAAFRKALEIEPDRDLALAGLGDLMSNDGRIDEARRLLEGAVSRRADQAEVRMALGRVYARLGRLGEATREMAEAARIDPTLSSAHAQYGIILMMQEQPARAIPHLERALDLDPQIYELRIHLAVMYHDLRRFEECEQALREAIAMRPQDPEPRRLLASLYRETGREEEARRAQEELDRIVPRR